MSSMFRIITSMCLRTLLGSVSVSIMNITESKSDGTICYEEIPLHKLTSLLPLSPTNLSLNLSRGDFSIKLDPL